jgi:glycerol kinase
MPFGIGTPTTSPNKSKQDRRGSIALVDTVKVDTQTLVDAPVDSEGNKIFIGSIDQGTSSSRFLVFSQKGEIVAYAQVETTQIYNINWNGKNQVGWHEHNPIEIWKTVVLCVDAVIGVLDIEIEKLARGKEKSSSPISIRLPQVNIGKTKITVESPSKSTSTPSLTYKIYGIGITNQRETTVAWNAKTGIPYYNAIVWDDTRTNSVANHIACGNNDRLRQKTGLPIASYFAGTKVKWLLDNVTELQQDMMSSPENVRFGTIDAWLLYQLTGTPRISDEPAKGNVGGVFCTDVSNASRWLFLDIEKVAWDKSLVDDVCSPHRVPLSSLPEVRASSEIYATLSKESTGIDKLQDVPVASILGDQQAALFGQAAFTAGEAKNTYGTGMFLMMNTGKQLVPSYHGLLTTIAYKTNDGSVYYALEGSVSHAGSTIQWLRDQLEIIEKASDSETYATSSNDGLYMVPAFAGLFAPYWRSDARGCIVGITTSHHKGHICRAALEAACYQAREVFDAIYADSKVLLKALKVDGGGTNNKLMMQFQADMINAPVVIPKVQETTAMGAAFAAGLAVGVWKNLDEVKAMWQVAETYVPKMSNSERQKNWAGWKKAITKSLNWVEIEDDEEDERFLDAQTFGDDYNIVPVTAPSPAADDEGDGIKGSSASSPVALFPYMMVLTVIAGIGVGIGFALGRRKH